MTADAAAPGPFEDALLDLLPDAVVGWDAQRRIFRWNRAACELYGYTRVEALGCHPAELLCTRFPVPPSEAGEMLADTGRWSGDLVQRTKDGRELTVEARWLAHHDEGGGVSLTIAVEREVTVHVEDGRGEPPREASERPGLHSFPCDAERLDRVGLLAGEITHDFNNCLAIIINYAALVAAEIGELAAASSDPRWRSVRGDIGEIQTAAERAARLTRQLLGVGDNGPDGAAKLGLDEATREAE